jgi:microcystin-dependent protein
MATVTGLTAARMKEIEDASVVDGEVVSGNLILTKHDGNQINAGSVIGPAGPQGPQGLSAIPGEPKLWPGDTLPELADWGRWVWADGGVYVIAEHPIAAAHIGTKWNRFDGAPDPGAGNFRVPDLRGLLAAGLDAMHGGARANRMSRAEAVTIALKTGKEYHILDLGQIPAHNHGAGGGASVSVGGGISGQADGAGGHAHTVRASYDYVQRVDANAGQANRVTGMSMNNNRAVDENGTVDAVGNHVHPLSGSFSGSGALTAQGGGGAHENVQPTVFVPYIVCLDE